MYMLSALSSMFYFLPAAEGFGDFRAFGTGFLFFACNFSFGFLGLICCIGFSFWLVWLVEEGDAEKEWKG